MKVPVYDICVVGAGPAGSLTALLAAKRGMSVLLLEAQAQPKRKICGEYLCPKGVDLLHSLGLGEVLESSRPIHGMLLHSPAGRSVASDFPGRSSGGRAIRRDRFDLALRNRAVESGADLKLGHRLESCFDEGTTWRIQTEGETYRARNLVGADGRQSVVARLMKASGRADTRRVALHAYVPVSTAGAKHGEMHILREGSYVGLNPTGEKEWNVSLVCDSDLLKEGRSPREVFETSLGESTNLRERFLPLPDGLEVFVTAPITHKVEKVAGPGWALVGDAAGFLDPLTGEGIYQALLSATLLDENLARASSWLGRSSPELYTRSRANELRDKSRVNLAFQSLIRQPKLCEAVAWFLGGRKRRADIFIGVVGNVLTPWQGLIQILF